MSTSSSSGYEPEQEVRFAVVMYGGVSLAIYINGIAQELLRMVRSTADLPSGESLKGSELIYRKLGQLLHPGREPEEGAEPPADLSDSPIKTRFVVDLISGSSAGGINGVALAKAIALRSRSLDKLAEVWLDDADLDLLLNDSKSEPDKYPPHPENRTVALLNGERMYGMVLETLTDMNDDVEPEGEGGAFADKLDLFVTTTDLAGLNAPIQLTGQTIDERIHRTVFRFEYTAETDDGAQVGPSNEFTRDYDPMLAFAARCTSSFPVAFEPMSFDRIAGQVKRQTPRLNIDTLAKEKYKKFFPAYDVRGEPFRGRLFADGGYLDNRPFSYVTDVVQYRSSTRPVKRKLLFIDPFPEVAEPSSEKAREIGFLENAMLAAMKLPRYEVIRGDIQRVSAMNRQLDRLAALRDRLNDDTGKLALQQKLPEAPKNFAALDLKDMVETQGFGDKYPPYHHLRVYETSDGLAWIVTRATQLTTDSDEYYFVRLLVRSWREANFSAYRTDGKKTENGFLFDYDADYRLRRLNQLRISIDDRLQSDLRQEERSDLKELRQRVEAQIANLESVARKLRSPARSPLLETGNINQLKQALTLAYSKVMNQVGRKARYKAADDVYEEFQGLIDPLMAHIQGELKHVFDSNREDLEEAWHYPGATKAREEIHEVYKRFHWHDSHTLPFLEGTSAREHSEIEVFRVSPIDGTLTYGTGKAANRDKLMGTRAAAFGGFMDMEWRENDMMWGRLDGAERIVYALLPDPRDETLRKRYIGELQDAILSEEFSMTVKAKRDRVFRCLARELDESGMTANSVDELVTNSAVVLERFPMLKQLIDRSEFRAFLKDWYNVSPSPPQARLIDWMSRSLQIAGRMIDDYPGAQEQGLSKRISGALKSAGVLTARLLSFALPQSLGRAVARYWLSLLALVGAVLAFFGNVMSAGQIAHIGYAVLLVCLVAFAVQHRVGRFLEGKVPLFGPTVIRIFRTFIALVILCILGLAGFGGYELYQELFGLPAPT